MDYQNQFSNPHPSFGGPTYSTLPGTPVHQATSPQQQQYDPNGRFMQSQSPFPYSQQFANGQGSGFAGMSGGLAPNGGLIGPPHNNQLHQARSALQQQHSSAPFSQPIPSPSNAHPSISSPANSQFAQSRQTQSPANANHSGNLYTNPQSAQRSPSVPSNNQQQMSLPSSQPQPSQPMQVQTPVKAIPQSPVSPIAQAREKERMTTLLEINTLLIKEVVELQSQGKAGVVTQPNEGGDKPQPSKEYVDCMRRLQSNLAFLAQNAEKNHKPNQPIHPGPAIMAVPAGPEELVKLYIKLQGLYPGWKGQTGQMKASPGPQRLNSNASHPNSAGMQPPNSAGLQSNMQPPGSAGFPPNMQHPKQEQSS